MTIYRLLWPSDWILTCGCRGHDDLVFDSCGLHGGDNVDADRSAGLVSGDLGRELGGAVVSE